MRRVKRPLVQLLTGNLASQDNWNHRQIAAFSNRKVQHSNRMFAAGSAKKSLSNREQIAAFRKRSVSAFSNRNFFGTKAPNLTFGEDLTKLQAWDLNRSDFL